MELKTKYTRRIDREYFRILSEGSTTITDGEGRPILNIQQHQVQLAKDYLVMEMFGLTQVQIDDMEVSEYNELLKLAEAQKDPL